jgi:hypothetical protein
MEVLERCFLVFTTVVETDECLNVSEEFLANWEEKNYFQGSKNLCS